VNSKTTRGCPPRNPRESCHAIHKCRLGGLRASLESVRHCLRAADFRRCAHLHRCTIGSDHDVRIEHFKKCVEVACARGCEESVNVEIWFERLVCRAHIVAKVGPASAKELPQRNYVNSEGERNEKSWYERQRKTCD
jgi:hypothetical protein